VCGIGLLCGYIMGIATREEVNKILTETLEGTQLALQRVLDKHDPDSIEYEWVGNANEALIISREV